MAAGGGRARCVVTPLSPGEDSVRPTARLSRKRKRSGRMPHCRPDYSQPAHSDLSGAATLSVVSRAIGVVRKTFQATQFVVIGLCPSQRSRPNVQLRPACSLECPLSCRCRTAILRALSCRRFASRHVVAICDVPVSVEAMLAHLLVMCFVTTRMVRGLGGWCASRSADAQIVFVSTRSSRGKRAQLGKFKAKGVKGPTFCGLESF